VTPSTIRLAISEVSIAWADQNDPSTKSEAPARTITTIPTPAAIARRRALSIAPQTTLDG